MKEEIILSELKKLVQEVGSYAYYIIGLRYANELDDINISQLVKDAGLTESMSKEIGKAKRLAEVIKTGKYGIFIKTDGKHDIAFNAEDKKTQLLRLYKKFIINCTSKAKSITNYTDFKRINECIEKLGVNEYKTLLDFDNPAALEEVVKSLNEQPLYIEYNEKGKNQYSNAVATYLQFLYALQLSGVDGVSSSSSSRPPLNLPHQQIFYGAPGTGKSHTIKKEVDEKGRINFRTTFHPDSDYSTFVGCYKPRTKEVPMRDVTGKVIVEEGHLVTEKCIEYSFVPQAFTKAYTAAWSTEAPVFLIIEEINRGNCAQIFGDLFQLLDRKNGESEYPIDADTDLASHIARKLANSTREIPEDVKSGRLLKLPANLYIWATMNTSDQSLFPIDSAFKRRWEWKYSPIKNHEEENYKIVIGCKSYDWWGFLEKINRVIDDTTNSEDKKLGYFFAKSDDKVINAEKFVGKVLFYLWNDVFKDLGFDTAIFSKEDGKNFVFSDFFEKDGSPNVDMVNAFLESLDKNVDKEKPFQESRETAEGSDRLADGAEG